jgi:signal transduction histidine kinase
VLQAVERSAGDAGNSWAGQYRFRRRDGSYAYVLDRGCIIFDAAGKPTRIVGGISDISERRHAEQALENSRAQLRALTARLQSGREEERSTVAREIHDELGQLLTAVKINLDWLEKKLGERSSDPALNPWLDRVVESEEMVDAAITSVQRIATNLRPASLDNLGLGEALQQEAQRFQQRNGITCELQLPLDALNPPSVLAIALFRVFQEALTNVARHAEAKAVRVVVTQAADHVQLQVEDNGRGIPLEAVAASRSLGLLGMRERALTLGGEVTIEPIAPRGTRVTLRLPVSANGPQSNSNS